MGSDDSSRAACILALCFNPRSRMGSDYGQTEDHSLGGCFNPRSRMGSDVCPVCGRPLVTGFNPRSRMGSDSIEGPPHPGATRVSIHAPAWGATTMRRASAGRPASFQSTLPHGERPPVARTLRTLKEVSIHAPAWGATIRSWPRHLCVRVSIHAPAWGATLARELDVIRSGFQSTLPHGERPRATSIL